MKSPEIPNRWLFLSVLCLVFLVGIFLRLPTSVFSESGSLSPLSTLHPKAGFQSIGFDEALYREYVDDLIRYGVSSYPDLAEHYVEVQRRLPTAILPPTRFLYVFTAYLWHEVFGSDALASLRDVSSLFSILLLFLAAGFALRLGGLRVALCVTALMSCAPTQIHMGQHALIDGFFAFWATLCLWLLWENLQHPNKWPWLMCYTLALALLVLTKENAMFAYVGLLLPLGANHRLRFGQISRALLLLTFVGPLLGVALLVNLCGSVDTAYHIFRLLVSKASVLPYAIATGDGPWYRYLIDLMVMSPVVLVLAIGGIFSLKMNDKASLFLLLFVVGSYLLMANVRYGMNLRYTNMWDPPLRYLAVGCLTNVSASFGKRPHWWLGIFIALVCAVELRQYIVFFVQHDLYELVTGGLLHAVKMLK
jgi:4-amino-4-deoxy-L-arabinose transferase-like glycosyltransferase